MGARQELLPMLKQNRPSSECIAAALFRKPGLILDFSVIGETSGLTCTLQGHSQRQILAGKRGQRSIQLETHTLSQILDSLKMPEHIDFLSLDTEGSELDILMGADLGRRSFGYIVVEHNFEEPYRQQLRMFLEQNSYRFARNCSVDDEY